MGRLSKLERFFRETSFADRTQQLLWSRMRSLENVFDAEGWKSTLNLLDRSEPCQTATPRQQTWPLTIADTGLHDSYLPIRAFRDAKVPIGGEGQAFRTFLSSGTSAQGRSRSRFTESGLLMYRLSALKTFESLLRAIFGEQSVDIHGFSLVPDPDQDRKSWQESSLAQMIRWLADFWNISYVGEDGHQLIHGFKGFGDRPVFVLGTAWHYINLFDWGYRTKLPPSSIVIETGGTKGRSRDLDRTAFYQLLTEMFGIQDHQIVSEYSMCELASQAWDWVRPESSTKKKVKRRFKFPGWVSAYSMSDTSIARTQGLGVLLINDRARIDVPWPIQTEDMVALNSDESFELLGRVPFAPLRGCSLLAPHSVPPINGQDTVGTQRSAKREDAASLIWSSDAAHFVINDSDVERRGTLAGNALRTFFDNPKTLNTLASEIKSTYAASASIENIKQALPTGENGWLATVRNAVSANTPQKWAIILPSNHSIAGLYPLAVAAVAGLSIKVRVPSQFAHSGSLIVRFLQILKDEVAQPGSIEVTGDEWFVGTPGAPIDYDALLAYGETTTIRSLREKSGKAVAGFGSAITVALITEDDLLHRSSQIAQDAFALAQKGCLATRVAILFSDRSREDLIRMYGPNLMQGFRGYWGGALDLPINAALVLEEVLLRQKGIPVVDRAFGLPLFPFYQAPMQQGPFLDLLPKRQFVLPILVAPRSKPGEARQDLVSSALGAIPDLSLVVYDSSFRTFTDVGRILKQQFPTVAVRRLGLADAPPWDGMHQGKPLFVPN